jgi:hypothetical protein
MDLAFRGVHRQLEQDMALTSLGGSLQGLVTIEANREQLPILTWDVQPGDVVLFGFRTLHYSTGVPDKEAPRRAVGLRWTGDDARFVPTVGNVPIFWDHGLRPGDAIGGPVFPQVLPTGEPQQAQVWSGVDEADPAIGFRDICERFSVLSGSVHQNS